MAWSNGGTEIELARESGVTAAEPVEALVVLDTVALGLGSADSRVLATCAMPVPLRWLRAAGLGRERVGDVQLESRQGRPHRLLSQIERVFARRVLETTEEVPQGSAAREAVVRLLAEGRGFSQPWKAAWKATGERLEAARLARDLARQGGPESTRFEEVVELYPEERYPNGVPSPSSWTLERLEDLGFEDGRDVALLSPEDLEAPSLPERVQDELDRRYPRRIELADAVYRVHYELASRRVTLEKVEGRRTEPPPLSWLPAFRGFALRVRHGDMLRTLRDRHGRLKG